MPDLATRAKDLVDQLEERGSLVIRTTAMPSDTNPSGDIFGGWLLAQMDLAAGNLSAQIARGRCATVAIDGIQFLRPVHVGDEVSIYAKLVKLGRSSITMNIQAWARPRHESNAENVINSKFVFVAIDEDGRPRPLPENAEDNLVYRRLPKENL